MRRLATVALWLVVATRSPDIAAAQTATDAPRLTWNEDWAKFRTADAIVSSAALVGTLVFQIVGPRETSTWNEAPAFDERARDAVVVLDVQARQNVLDASDLLLSTSASLPFLFDAFVSAWWYHESPEVGLELALLAVEAQLLTSMVQSAANMVASRVRPYVRRCGDTVAADDRDCIQPIRFRSFFSGHASAAFAGAVTSCVFHARLPLHGGGGREALQCALGLASASLTGLFRMLGDMHYATDVLAGAVVGSTIGALVPLLHMRPRTRRPIAFFAVPSPRGIELGVGGVL